MEYSLLLDDLKYLVKSFAALNETANAIDTPQDIRNDSIQFARLAENKIAEIEAALSGARK